MKMRNRAKCKLCNDIIESFHHYDYVSCKCGEISIDGGMDVRRCMARNWDNFLRVDDEGNEIIVKVKEKEELKPLNEKEIVQDWVSEELKTVDKWPESKPTKKELIGMLDDMRKNIEALPQQAMTMPINHYDFCSLLILLSSILRAED
jgi:hypothetical protein